MVDIEEGWMVVFPKICSDDMIVTKVTKLAPLVEFKNNVCHRYFVDEYTGRTCVICCDKSKEMQVYKTADQRTWVLPDYVGYASDKMEKDPETGKYQIPGIKDGTIILKDLKALQQESETTFWADGIEGDTERSRGIFVILPISKGDVIQERIDYFKNNNSKCESPDQKVTASI